MTLKFNAFFLALCAGVISMAMVGCGDDESVNNPSIMFLASSDVDYRYTYDNEKYVIDRQVEKSLGLMVSSLDETMNFLTALDSTDIPDKSVGEFDYIEMEFTDEKKVKLINRSYSVDEDYNTAVNWIIHCEVVEGSKFNFDNGENIKLKVLNNDSLDASYSVYLKAIFVKSLHADAQTSSSKYNQFNNLIVCNKNEILWKSRTLWFAKFLFDRELIELLRTYDKG